MDLPPHSSSLATQSFDLPPNSSELPIIAGNLGLSGSSNNVPSGISPAFGSSMLCNQPQVMSSNINVNVLPMQAVTTAPSCNVTTAPTQSVASGSSSGLQNFTSQPPSLVERPIILQQPRISRYSPCVMTYNEGLSPKCRIYTPMSNHSNHVLDTHGELMIRVPVTQISTGAFAIIEMPSVVGQVGNIFELLPDFKPYDTSLRPPDYFDSSRTGQSVDITTVEYFKHV